MLLLRAAQRSEANDTPEFRRQAVEMHRVAVEALREGDADTAWAELSKLGALLRRGVAGDRSLQDLSEQVKNMVNEQEKAWKVALTARSTFTSEDFRVILLALVGALEDQDVPFDKVLAAMARIDQDFFGGRFGFARSRSAGAKGERIIEVLPVSKNGTGKGETDS